MSEVPHAGDQRPKPLSPFDEWLSRQPEGVRRQVAENARHVDTVLNAALAREQREIQRRRDARALEAQEQQRLRAAAIALHTEMNDIIAAASDCPLGSREALQLARSFASRLPRLSSDAQLTCLLQAPRSLITGQALEVIGGAVAEILAQTQAHRFWHIISSLPPEVRFSPAVWAAIATRPPREQVDHFWPALSGPQEPAWLQLAPEVRLLCIYRAAASGAIPARITGALECITDEPPVVQYALHCLKAQRRPSQANEAFYSADKTLDQWLRATALTSTAPLQLESFLPPCAPGKVPYCEGLPWPTPEDRESGRRRASRIWCPRAARECIHRQSSTPVLRSTSTPYGARVYAVPALPWWEWSFIELLQACGITPDPRLPRPDDYPGKLAGHVNRLNEIRPRLKCSYCGEIMRPDRRYAKNLAVYAVTVMQCPAKQPHETVYFNHCWACWKLIDSRESQHRVGAYFVCIHCGSGPEKAPDFSQGDLCPMCGVPHMEDISDGQMRCAAEECGHIIELPRESQLTGARARGRRYDFDVFGPVSLRDGSDDQV